MVSHLLLEDRRYYVYIYLDPRKPGKYIYGKYEFDYEPFYVGKGHGNRINQHIVIATKHLDKSTLKSRIIRKILNLSMDPIRYKLHSNLTNTESSIIEKSLISLIGRRDFVAGPLVNHTAGGDGNTEWSPEARKYASERQLGKKAKPLSEEHKRKISLGNKGKTNSIETRKKISQARLGKPMSEENRLKMRGRKASDEARQNMSKARKGKPFSEQHKLNMSKASLGKKKSASAVQKMKETKRRQREEKLRKLQEQSIISNIF